jgi:hypothetical protein
MSEVAIRPDTTAALDLHDGNDAVAQLARWAQAADAAYQMARKLVTTTFVPQQYRGKPEEATAAILAGAELGLGPMAALRSFHNIQGTPAASAMTLRAIVQSKGHEIRVLEATPERATVAGRRAGDEDWQTSTWDIDRAKAMGLIEKNPQYRKQPANMLLARATSEVCRWVASDAIMGMPYSAEELRDQDGDPDQSRPRAMRVTTADILGQPETPAILATDPDPQWSEPTGDSLTAADVLEEIAAAETQIRLDEIKAVCQYRSIRDPQVLEAWSVRSAELLAEAEADAEPF